MGKCLFVTGTGTDVGKTYVTALIVKKLVKSGKKAGYYKAAISGAEVDAAGKLVPGDAVYVKNIAGLDSPNENLVSYVYPEAVSPHLAARLNDNPIDFARIERDFSRARESYDYLTMEGSGGIICPLRWDGDEHWGLDDMVKRLGLSVVMVADAGLGTINAAVLTEHYLRSQNIPLKGIILNHYHENNVMEQDNLKMIEAMTKVPVIATVSDGDTELNIDADDLAKLYE